MRQSNPNNDTQNVEVREPQTAEEYLQYAQDLLGSSGTTRANGSTEQPVTQNLTFAEQVNKVLKEVTVDDKGKFVYPANLSEHIKYAVAAEKKYRDTQAGFTKSQIELKSTAAEVEALREQLAKVSGRLDIPQDKLDELEELKFSDPDEWFKRKLALEQEVKSTVKAKMDEQMSEVRKNASVKAEIERRLTVLEDFNIGRAVPITTEMLDNDVPARITKKLEAGHLTFEGYLAEVDAYLSKAKVAGYDNPTQLTKLTSVSGSGNPPTESYNLETNATMYDSITF